MILTKILKHANKGLILYSPVFGNVTFMGITEQYRRPIIVRLSNGNLYSFDDEGRMYTEFKQGECMLFPSKDKRDWKDFSFNKYSFKPFDKVLVRDSYNDSWHCDLFSHYEDKRFITTGGSWVRCIPYEGNEALSGTNIDVHN